MNDLTKDGGVCGLDRCSTGPTTAASRQSVRTAQRAAHNLTIISDVICLWCFVAKKNLNKTLELVGSDLAVKISWRPFELNPTMPEEGMDRRAYRSRKFTSWEHSQALDAQVVAAGQLAGLEFRHELIARTPNTFKAHRLIWLADEEDVQNAVVEALFRAYFTEGRDVGDTSVLTDIAAQSGMKKESIVAFLGGAGADEVRREAKISIKSGISGVPTFILDGQELFSGALTPDLMAARFREAVLADAT